MKLTKSLVLIALLALVVVAGCAGPDVVQDDGDAGTVEVPSESVSDEPDEISGVADSDLVSNELDEDLSLDGFDSFESDLDDISW